MPNDDEWNEHWSRIEEAIRPMTRRVMAGAIDRAVISGLITVHDMDAFAAVMTGAALGHVEAVMVGAATGAKAREQRGKANGGFA